MSVARIVAAVAAVAIGGGALVLRRRLSRGRLLLALAAAGVLGIYASGLLSGLPDAETLIEDLAQALGPWTYLLVGAMAFLETGAFVGLIAPGETAVLLGGVVAGQGEISLLPLIGLVWACALAGDSTSFLIGRRLGRQFLLRHGPRMKISPERLEQVEGYFGRHGGKTILIGRFIGLVRALAPFVAGSSRMPYGRFLPYSVIGTGLWSSLFTLLGYIFWRSFDRVANIAGKATLGFGLLVGLVAAGVFLFRKLRTPEGRRRAGAWIERQAERPLARPVARVARPVLAGVVLPGARAARAPLGFLRDRLTPGGLGIELSTAVAVAAAGLFTFVLLATEVGGENATLAGDRLGLDLADELRSDALVDVAKVATDLGALPVAGALVLLLAVVLAVRGRPTDGAALAAGIAILFVSVHAAKAGIDRPRPPGPLTGADGASYPSGHAAYSTAYVALAVAARRALPGLATRAALVAVGLGVAALVGVTRVYLRVHFWTDVVGGWALGLSSFALCAAGALAVSHMRQNQRPDG